MWKNSAHKKYVWLGIGEDVNSLLKDLEEAEVDEEADLFRLRMHLDSADDLSVFEYPEREKVEQLISILVRDTKRHSKIISKVSAIIDQYKKDMES